MQRTTIRHRSICRLVSGAGLVAALILLPTHATAQWIGMGGEWSAPGSTGVVDEASMPFVMFDHAKAAVRPTAPTGSSVLLRYPVVLSSGWVNILPDSPYNLADAYSRATLTLSFQRNDEHGQIVALLRRVRLSDGETTLMLAVDGNASPSSPGVQTVTRNLECHAPCILPDEYAYWVEVALWKVRATSDPKVVGVGVRLLP
jgi:hypothetical protein